MRLGTGHWWGRQAREVGAVGSPVLAHLHLLLLVPLLPS